MAAIAAHWSRSDRVGYMAMSYHFDPRSTRVSKARFARFMHRFTSNLGIWIGVTIVAAGALLLGLGQHREGLILLGVGSIMYCFGMWVYYDVLRLPAALPVSDGDLTQMLESSLAARLQWPATTQTLWKDAANDWRASFILVRLGIPADLIDTMLPATDEEVDRILEQAVSLATSNEADCLHSGHIIAAILITEPAIQSLLKKMSLNQDVIGQVVAWLERILSLHDLRRSVYGGIGRDWAAGFAPTLEHFAANLSREIELGGHNFASLAHGEAVEQVISSFNQGSAGIALIGEPGAGKTSTAYALTQRLIEGDGGRLAYKQVYSLNASLLISAANRPGELEQLLLTIIGEAIAAGNVILVFDEAQLFFGTGTGAIDLGQLLLPVMQSRRISILMTLDPTSWQRLVAAYASLAATFTSVAIQPPDRTETLAILADTALGFELPSNTITQYAALTEAYRLSERYVTEQAYPGRAIKVLEQAYSHAEGRLVTAQSVQRAIESTLGVKVVQAQAQEADQLLHLEDEIHKRMINQTRAVQVVSAALRRARAGVASPKRPLGSFLFLGPTGVGKTELARSLAAIYYGGEETMTRLDLSEYQQASDIDRLLAADSAFLTAVRRQPFGVVLLDELEKAHANFLNLLLQLLDEGQLTDTAGRSVSFKDAIIIATSNAGAEEIRRHIENGERLEDFESAFTDNLISSGQYKPELLNRFDEIVLFRPLNEAELVKVVGLMIDEVNVTLKPQNISVALTEAAVKQLVKDGYDPRLGARPMRRMVQRTVENATAEQILRQQVSAGDTITLDVGDLAIKSSN